MRRIASIFGILLICLLAVALAAHAEIKVPTTQPATKLATQPTTQRASTKPAATQPWKVDVVILDELVDLYEPVPFDHKSHALMAEMWDGCMTCHHVPPPRPGMPATTRPATQATTAAATAPTNPAIVSDKTTSLDIEHILACQSCHPVKNDSAAMHLPTLKGAYHRQCLNCHREWMDANACVICHAARAKKGEVASTFPTTARLAADDIVGRMHKPIPPPKTVAFKSRFTPEAGPNVLFNHEEHARTFALRCVSCHRRDSCADCHSTSAVREVAEVKPHPLKVGKTWRESHGPCLACHQNDRCNHCHYPDDQKAPPPFAHQATGQTLDKDHAALKCAQCHSKLKAMVAPTCGDASCHSRRAVSLPIDRPGAWNPAATQPATRPIATPPASRPTTTQPTTQPATRPTVIRIRRSGP